MLAKKIRHSPTYNYEIDILKKHSGPVAGVDEAGRGPWAGPVVAAAVILNPSNIPEGIDDSKALDAKKRDIIYDEILKSGASFAIGIADVDRIDRDNILNASLWAMAEAIDRLPLYPQFALIDGNIAPKVKCQTLSLIKGDSKSLSIAAASILAKVIRDRMMCDFETQFPGYGFARHKGYGTLEHMNALTRLGISPIHRKTFKPIQIFIGQSSNNREQS